MAVPIAKLLVEPSTHHVDAVLRAGLPSGTQAMTLPVLEAKLAQSLLPGVRVASPALSRVVLRAVLVRDEAARALAARAGLEPEALTDAAEGALAALRGACVEPEALRAVGGERGAALAAILSAHDRALGELSLIDGHSLAMRLVSAISASEPARVEAALSGAGEVEIRDVAALAPARLAWIEALQRSLSARAARVVLVTPTAQDSLLFVCGIDDPRELVAAKLEARFAASTSPPELVHRSTSSGEGPCARLASRLFAPPASPVDVEGRVRLVTAASAEVAAEVAAAEAASALRRGVAPERVVIAMPTLDELVVRPLRRAMRALSVPFWEPRGAPPSAAEPVAVILELLRAFDAGIRKELLVERLLAGGPSPRGLRVQAARALERLPGSDLERHGEALLAGLDEPLRAVVAPLLALLRPPKSPELAGALAQVESLAGALGYPGVLGRGAAAAIAADDGQALAALAADLAAWSSLADAVSELGRAAALAGESRSPVTWTEVARELEIALEQRRGVPSSRTGAVPLARLRDRLGLECDVLIILEAHDGALPARAADGPLLSRALLRALRARDPACAPPSAALASAVDLLAATDAIGHTRERVVVVHRGVDEDGRAQLPGALPTEIARASNVRPEIARAHAIPVALARTPRDLALFGVAHGAEVDADVRARADAERERARAFAAGEGAVPSRWSGLVEEPAKLAHALGDSPRAPLSVSAAEDILACPFLVFAERVLRARDDEPTPDDGGARDLGDVAHAALHAAYTDLRDHAFSTADEDALRATSAAAIDRVFAERPATTALMTVRRERLRDELLSLVHDDHEHMRKEGRRFRDGEVPFGEGQPWPALSVGGAVWIAGRIDRVDVGSDFAVVIDYKSRAPAGVAKGPFFAERKKGSVQIALYARVVAENLGVAPVRGRFLGYRDREHKEHFVGIYRTNDDVWRAQAGDAAGGVGPGEIALALAEAVTAARAGAVPPRRSERCAQCRQRVACRVPAVVLEGEGQEP